MVTARDLLLVPLLCALGQAAQEPASKPASNDGRLGPAAEQEADARKERIRAEVAGREAATSWAGHYYRGDGLGVSVTLDLAPETGFVFTWHGCGGLYDRNYGTVREKDGRLELAFTFSNVRGLAPVLVPVRWGERHYLVGSDELRKFANAVNGGQEPRNDVHGIFLLRSGDEARPANGTPELPKEVAALLLPRPVEGTIVTVHETRFETQGEITWRVTEATIDRGAEHGLWQDLGVHFHGKPALFDGTVIELGKTTASIRIRFLGDDKAPMPEAG